ncbi:MAG: Xaa-Pro peptidase family protein [Ignavibacteriaceae bacterium]|nr:Xaa-Pro peptidase family protein [Ignavibacteriaceae bacterium]
MSNLFKEKINQAVEILKEKEVDMWLTFVRESSIAHDPALDMIAGINLTWESALIINRDGETAAIVGSLELDNIKNTGLFDSVEGYLESFTKSFTAYLDKKNPTKIAINFSKNSTLADGLTHGLYLNLLEHLKNTPYAERLISSEEIIAALRGRKSQTELNIMKEAIDETLKIFDDVTGFLKPGVTELEISKFVKAKAAEKGFGMAWDDDHCPAVFTGPDAGGAHSGPTNNIVQKGHIVNMDFGILHKGYCSDLQRMWYILRDGETEAPAEVKKGFEVIRDSIQKAAAAIKPGMQGCQIDDVARNYIIENGYEGYPHGLGHQVGKVAHDGGSGLFPRWDRYGNAPFIPIEEGQIYTIEPRLTVEGFGTATLEEEIVVTKNGCKFISEPQKELILVR